MSVWRQQKAIERAVAGQLDPRDDEKLRRHLRGCLECRRFYDALTVQARILAGDPHSTAAAAERELARLMGTLAPANAPAPRPAWQRFAFAAACAAVAVLGIVSWQRSSSEEPLDQIAWRGVPVDPKVQFGVWLVTAPQDGGLLRRDVSFPGAEAAVRSTEWVAFRVAQSPGPIGFFRAVLVNEQGQTLVLQAGRSVALDPGKWRAFAVGSSSDAGVDDAALAAAARAAGVAGRSLSLPGSAQQASGIISVLP